MKTPLQCVFMVTATVGLVLGLANRERIEGTGRELTVLVYWFSIMLWIIDRIPWSWTATFWLIGLLGVLAVTALVVAAVLKWGTAPPGESSSGDPPRTAGSPSPAPPLRPQPSLHAGCQEAGGVH